MKRRRDYVGWLRRADLDTDREEVWEMPDGRLYHQEAPPSRSQMLLYPPGQPDWLVERLARLKADMAERSELRAVRIEVVPSPRLSNVWVVDGWFVQLDTTDPSRVQAAAESCLEILASGHEAIIREGPRAVLRDGVRIDRGHMRDIRYCNCSMQFVLYEQEGEWIGWRRRPSHEATP